MQRKFILIMLFAFCAVFSRAGAVQAGTWFAGAKMWSASWDSAMLDWFEEDLAYSFLQQNYSITSHTEPGKGYLAGPMIGYQPDGSKWSYSFAPMVFSSFSQDWRGMAGPMVLNAKVDLQRKDFDFAASRKLTDNLKYYVGYKYQDMNMDFRLSYSVGMMGTQSYLYKVDSEVHIPTVGISGVYELKKNLVVGGQFGLLYTIPSMKMTTDGVTTNIRPWSSFGFNVEGNVTYRPWQKWLFQAGYRYQAFEIIARAPGRTDDTKSYDITHGLTLSAIYLF